MNIKNIFLGGGRFATGIAMKKFINNSYDYVLYPVVLTWLGYTLGGIVLTIAAAVINLLLIKGYDWAETDWFFIEKLKHVKDNPDLELPTLVRWFRPVLNMGDIPAFFVLCLDDPVTVTLYLRKGAYQYNGLSRRDWFVFIAANIVANLYWIIGWVAVIEFFKSAGHLFF
jgi:hypothetical protein